jgi:hypothetical protein
MLLVADAWFDYMSAAPRLAYAQAMLLAVVIELRLAAILVWASRIHSTGTWAQRGGLSRRLNPAAASCDRTAAMARPCRDSDSP